MIGVNTEHIEVEQAEKMWKQQVNQVRSYIDNFWEMGAITAEVLKNARYGKSTLSKFAREVGNTPLNLYRYCRVYKEILQDIKDKYSKILSFCMFEELIKFGIQKKKFDEYLEKAIHENYSVAEFGRFLSGTLAGAIDAPVKPVVLRFPGELRSIIDEILETLAQKFKIDADADYKKNKDILTGFVMACKDYLDGAVKQDDC